MGSPNWAKLKEQGRCKEVGVPWSSEEAKAVFELHIPAPYVRRGCLTVDSFNEMKAADDEYVEKHGEKSLEAMGQAELYKKAVEADVEVTPQATADGLRSILEGLKPKKKAAPKKAAKKVSKKKVEKKDEEES